MKKNTIWVLFENYCNDNENHINVFSSYEKGKKQFDKIIEIRKSDWYFDNMEKEKDYTLSDTYCCLYNTWTEIELRESEIDSLDIRL